MCGIGTVVYILLAHINQSPRDSDSVQAVITSNAAADFIPGTHNSAAAGAVIIIIINLIESALNVNFL